MVSLRQEKNKYLFEHKHKDLFNLFKSGMDKNVFNVKKKLKSMICILSILSSSAFRSFILNRLKLSVIIINININYYKYMFSVNAL